MNKLEKYLLQRIEQLEMQLRLYTEEFTHVRGVEETLAMLKAGSFDDTITKMRDENRTVQAIANEIGVPDKKRDIDRVIARLKNEKKLP